MCLLYEPQKKRVEFVVIIFITTAWYFCCYTLPQWCNIYRISTILKVEIDIIAYISASSIGWAGIFVIMSVCLDVIVLIGDIIMCFTSDWPINWRMWVTYWLHIFVDQAQSSDPDFIRGTDQSKMSNLPIINISYTCQRVHGKSLW